MKQDIIKRDDIEKLINAFYERVMKDELISYFFTKVVEVNWQKHLPVMYDFWENVVFHTGNYEGNPMAIHQNINKMSPMKMEHFQRWILLFNQTVDELYEGQNAENIKQRAMSIATVMQIKIFN